MSQLVPHHRYTFVEYVRLEEFSNVKHEFYAGEIFAMAGGTPDHAALAMNFGAALLALVRERPCRVFSSDLRVRVVATGLATYPHVTLVCGSLERDPEDRNTVTNPLLVVEVLSASTEEYDRGDKLQQYKLVPSLRECVLISHRERRIEIWRRWASDAWIREEASAGLRIRIESLDGDIAVDDVYRAALEDSPARA